VEQVQLQPGARGSLNMLTAVPWEARVQAGAGVVEVRVVAVGLNFRDVLNVLGQYPGNPGPPGSDCACLMVGAPAGSGVRGGDAVFGLVPGSLGTRGRSWAELLPPKPAALSFEAAATVPTVFVTVDVALRCAGAGGGSGSVLVHAGAGSAAVRTCDAGKCACALCASWLRWRRNPRA
jgi:NADPH:quinone reductase-like Zn-dependent oxidoreductase